MPVVIVTPYICVMSFCSIILQIKRFIVYSMMRAVMKKWMTFLRSMTGNVSFMLLPHVKRAFFSIHVPWYVFCMLKVCAKIFLQIGHGFVCVVDVLKMVSLPISFRELCDSAISALNQDNIHNETESESDSDVSM